MRHGYFRFNAFLFQQAFAFHMVHPWGAVQVCIHQPGFYIARGLLHDRVGLLGR